MKTENTNCTLVIKDGKILLTKRSGTNFVGWWCFPGGHAEKGETMHQAAQREANEEIGGVKVEATPFMVLCMIGHQTGIQRSLISIDAMHSGLALPEHCAQAAMQQSWAGSRLKKPRSSG